MTEFFRHCPECGRRFQIKLENKKMLHLERNTLEGHRTHIASGTAAATKYSIAGPAPRGTFQIMVSESRPVIMDIEEFQYMYKCSHCGHEWSEKHSEQHKES